MLFLFSLAVLLGTATARSPAQHPLPTTDFHFPSIHESTVMARRILHLSTTGTLITTFPDPAQSSSNATADTLENIPSTLENRPAEMANNPIGLMEYYADCEPTTGNPTLLAINIATPYKNFAAGSNISLHIRWWPTQTHTYLPFLSSKSYEDPDIPTPHTPAALPRFSLHGRLEPFTAVELVTEGIPACFLKAHPDSVLWQPGNDIHSSEYVRFVVEQVYWFGGFGDRARIGWLPIEEWRGVTLEEVEGMRLPGEGKRKGTEGWREWL